MVGFQSERLKPFATSERDKIDICEGSYVFNLNVDKPPSCPSSVVLCIETLIVLFVGSFVGCRTDMKVGFFVALLLALVGFAVPVSTESSLLHLCEFIEDSEFTMLLTLILYLLGELGPHKSVPPRFIRFIYNRVMLENTAVLDGSTFMHPYHFRYFVLE